VLEQIQTVIADAGLAWHRADLPCRACACCGSILRLPLSLLDQCRHMAVPAAPSLRKLLLEACGYEARVHGRVVQLQVHRDGQPADATALPWLDVKDVRPGMPFWEWHAAVTKLARASREMDLDDPRFRQVFASPLRAPVARERGSLGTST